MPNELDVRTGLLLVQGGCLPQQVKTFLQTPQEGEDIDVSGNYDETIKFYVLPSESVGQAVEQGTINTPFIWIDEEEDATGTAALRIAYCLGSAPQLCRLPFKKIKLQPNRKGGSSTSLNTVKSFIASKLHLQLYRVVHLLFPTLVRWDQELRRGDVVFANNNSNTPRDARIEQVRAMPTDQGLLLERHCPVQGITVKLQVAINFSHGCLELQQLDADVTGSQKFKCLRTLHSLDEALSALRGQVTQLAASPRISPSKVMPSIPPFQSPSKPPRRPSRCQQQALDGVAMVATCSSAHLRDGASLLQAAAAEPIGATTGIGAGAMEALVGAAASVLPSTVMGMTEQLTLLTLTVAALLDSNAASPGGNNTCDGAERLVGALAVSLQTTCANPTLLCKLLVALLQRPDVRLEAVRQGLATTISTAYLRKSPLLEPLAVALLSPTTSSTGRASSLSPATSLGLPSGTSPPTATASLLGGASPVSVTPQPKAGLRLSGTKLSVPRLVLRSEEDASNGTPRGGLTRATRRELSGTPSSEWQTPGSMPWGSPRPRSAAKDVTAVAEMSLMAEALGESLMAMDLPSTVAHKRGADALKAPKSDDEGVPSELFEGALLTARQQTLQAHRIFTAVGSQHSVDSSSDGGRSGASAQGGDGTGNATGPSEGRSAPDVLNVHLADSTEVKCLMLQALLEALPALGIDMGPAQDPSPILAAEVLTLPTRDTAPALEALRSSCLELLARLSRRAEGRRGEPHVFLTAAGTKLTQLLGGGGRISALATSQAAQLMQAVADYAALVATPSVATAVARHCLGPVGFALGALQAAGTRLSSWETPSWELLHAMLVLMAPSLTHCVDAEAGRAFLAALLADYKAAAVLTAVADVSLLRAADGPATPRIAYQGRIPALQRDVLAMFTALIGLIGRQPALPGGASISGDPGSDLLVVVDSRRVAAGCKLTRRHGLHFFSSLIAPGNPFLRRVLDHPTDGPATDRDGTPLPRAPPSSAAVRLRQGFFELLRAAFSAPGSPYVADKTTADYFVRFHFIQFLKLYHNPDRDHQAAFLCRQHMATLLVLARAGGDQAPHVRHRFLQLSVVDFFVRELALEFEASQPGVVPMARSEGSLGSVSELLSGAKGGVGRRVTRIGSWKASPTGSAREISPLVGGGHQHQQQQQGSESRHKRSLSHPGKEALNGGGDTMSMHSPLVPKLRLPGSGGKLTISPEAHLSPGSPGSGRSGGSGAAAGRPSSYMGSPRASATSRLGREAAAQAAASSSSSHRPSIPKLGLGGLGLSLEHREPQEVDDVPLSSSPMTSGRVEERISAAASVPLLQLASSSPAVASGSGSSLPPRPLERFISAAISLDAEWPVSGRAGPSDSKETVEEEGESASRWKSGSGKVRGSASRRRWPSGSSVGSLPVGFVFSGDLDEDVEMLEALENEEESDASSDTSSTSNGGGSAATPAPAPSPAAPRLSIPRLTVPPKAPTDKDGLELGVPRLPDSPPSRPSGPAVPRLPITPSMHSTLEARTASAEMQVAEEAEVARRKAGRSFFGDLEKSALGKGKMQAATAARRQSRSSPDAVQLGAAAPEVSYGEERQRRMLYRDDELHLQVLVLVFSLILDAHGQLDWAYCDQYPWYRKLQNIPYVLHHHLNHVDNRPILPRLLASLHDLGTPALRLARTLCATFFRPSWYARRARISGVAGAYATVYRCTLPEWTGRASVVLKLLDTPKHIQDRCAQVDFHSEVTILDALAGRPSVCEMYDFGLDNGADAMYLVLKDYKCSLKQWRARQPPTAAPQLRLYYAIFREIAVAVRGLLDSGVVHFDLKCDNILLEPLPGVSPVDFWAPQNARPPFRVVLGDFGESKMYCDGAGGIGGGIDGLPRGSASGSAEGAATSRARGTDAFKSPEMLLVGGVLHKSHRTFDRRRQQGAGAPSDVWSLGCLLFELVTGRLLFSDTDWLQLVARVTSPGMQLITDDRAHLVSELPGVLELLQYMLIRDPALRPTLRDTLAKLDAILAINGHRMPAHSPPSPPTAATADGWAGCAAPEQPPTMPVLERPLPFCCVLPFLPSLFVSPTACITPPTLRAKAIRRVVIVAGPGGSGTTNNGGAPLVPLIDILGSEELSSCTEACAAAGAGCEIIRGPSQEDAASLVAWVEEALPAAHLPVGKRHDASAAPVLLASQEGHVGHLALLAIAHLVREEGLSTYLAMVRASHWGIDLHLTSAHLQALRHLEG